MVDNNSPGPSGVKRLTLSKGAPKPSAKRPLTQKELEEEVNKPEQEFFAEVSSESEEEFSDDSIEDKLYEVPSSGMSEGSESSEEDELSEQPQHQTAEIEVEEAENNDNVSTSKQKRNKQTYVSDEKYGWSQRDDEPKQFDFTGTPNINTNLPQNARPLGYVELFFDKNIIDTIVRETNKRAKEFIQNQPRPTRRTQLTTWKDITNGEMKKFLGLCALGGSVKFPSISQQWSCKSIYYHPVFGKTMGRNRFFQILRMLRLVDHDHVDTKDRLYKIRNILDMVVGNIKKHVYPNKELSIDEAMILWRGRLSFRQYISNKRHKYGIKLYELTTHDGFILNIIVYTGKGSLTSDQFSHSEEVVRELMKDYFNKGHVIYMDNYYNSVSLAEYLYEQKTHVVGTLRENRQGNPKDLLKTKLKKGQAVFKIKGPVLVTMWKDKRDVRMISTKHKHQMVEHSGKRGTKKIKPACVLDYNKHMSGIDRADQMLSYYSIPRKTLRWYRKIFFHLFDIAIWNGYYVFKKMTKSKMTFLEFREQVIEDLIQTEVIPKKAQNPNESPHFPGLVPQTEKNKQGILQCRCCTKKKLRRRTRYCCSLCPESPGLCVDPCFREWHMKK